MGDPRGIWDAVIAGAGPAGCHCAWELARRGLSVLLLDRQRFPRWKPCAGGLSARAAELLPESLKEHFLGPVRVAEIGIPGARTTRVESRRNLGWLVHRTSFDHAHVELVRALPGVEVREGCELRGMTEDRGRAVVLTSDGPLMARVVVGADGAGSVLSRCLAGAEERRVATAFEAEAAFVGDGLPPMLRFDFGVITGGYGWLFTKGEQCSMGAFATGGRSSTLRDGAQSYFAALNRELPFEFRRTRGARIPVGGTRRPLHGRRVLLVGDAADAVDPITGEGIVHALRSARWAAQAIDDYLRRGEPLAAYGAKMWRDLHRDFAVARRLAGLLYRGSGSGAAILFRNRILCGWFVRVLRGELSYTGLLALTMLCLPILATGQRPRPARIVFRPS